MKLSNTAGISGYEGSVEKIIKEELKNDVDKFEKDNVGSLISIKKGKTDKLKIMLAAHMDEVGFIINRIDENGFLFFTPIGGWWSQVLLGQRVKVITSANKEFIGTIGSKPPHILPKEQRDKVVEIKDMFIDLGAENKEQILENGIKVGDMIVPESVAIDMLNEDYILGKAWDNRIGCLILIEVMKKLQEIEHESIVYGVATTQEEIGLKGAKTSSNLINPDIALALDTGIAGDMPGITEAEAEAKLGQGPQVTLYDAGMIINPKFKEYIFDQAEKANIPIQPEILLGGATDAGNIQLNNKGVLTTCISVPTRYLHSHNAVISKKDVDNAIELVVSIIKDLNIKKFEEMIK